MRRCTEDDLQNYERLVAEASMQVVRQQALIDQCKSIGTLDEALRVLDEMTKTLAIYEQERRRILEALTK